MSTTECNVCDLGGLIKIPWELERAIQLRHGTISDGVALKPLLIPWKLYMLFEKNASNIEAYKLKKMKELNVTWFPGLDLGAEKEY